ncbi:UNVERIFIED_CONTAM: hypothetical protein PYX00_002319 [Menopon gallinae]|uniref:Mff-like domain-containing protein n=1 Tax=Menopon gallinae TaxID=328185 RepID=A0AAW2IHB4_9NEOP
MMSNVSSPTRFSGVEDHFFDHINISEKMRVPKQIKVSGDHDNAESVPRPNPWDQEKFDMKVPDRILVVGQDQYYGTTAPPREVVLENSVMPPDPGMIRVQTPPRVITLNEHYFPTVEDDEEDVETSSSFSPVSFDRNTSGKSSSFGKALIPSDHRPPVPNFDGSGDDLRKGLTPTEELSHLRTQMAKLNRRLLALELDNNQRQSREMSLIAVGLGYFFVKFLFWLNK